MARYPKYEHTIGTLHQINNLLEIASEEVIPDEYTDPLLTSAMFLHVGHLPFTLTTERAVLLASNMGEAGDSNPVRDYLSDTIYQVLNITSMDEERKEALAESVFSMRNTDLLYRFLSAGFILSNRREIKNIAGLSEGDFEIIIENLIDETTDGHGYLSKANKADYVQRDALYLGTAKIDVSPKHLYSGISKYQPSFGIDEETLIDINFKYIRERFYKSDEVVWFSRLLEKVIASLALSKNFEKEYLEEYNDREFERLITEGRDKSNSAANLPSNWCDRADDILSNNYRFEKVFQVGFGTSPIYCESDTNVISLEYDLVGKSASLRGLLKYPFEEGFLLSLGYPLDIPDHDEDAEGEMFSAKVFKDQNSERLSPLLRVAKNMIPRLGFSGVGKIRTGFAELLSSTGHARFDTKYGLSKEVTEAVSRAIKLSDSSLQSLLTDIKNLSSFSDLWRAFENRIWLLLDGALLQEPGSLLTGNLLQNGDATGLLSLPTRLLQCSDPEEFLDDLRVELKDIISRDDTDIQDGVAFESLCLLERMSNERDGFQLFMNGLYEVDPEAARKKRNVREHDIVEFVDSDEGSEIFIYACTISDNYQTKDRDSLRIFAEHIHDNVLSDTSINTRHMIPDDKENGNWEPKVINAGTNF